jgi:hypothetical protein
LVTAASGQSSEVPWNGSPVGTERMQMHETEVGYCGFQWVKLLSRRDLGMKRGNQDCFTSVMFG